ncbi:hypothetical protein EOM81_13345, partial [bacterium]|nr:hypothetical protein [bacterium]
MEEKFISFASRALTENSVRLPVIFENDQIIALDKPVGIFSTFDKFSPNSQKNIAQVLLGNVNKPECQRVGIISPCAVYELEFGMSGVFMLSKTQAIGNELKNSYGSDLLTFEFIFVTPLSDMPREKEFSCELPIAKHFNKDESIISHKTGKKSVTTFKFLEQFGAYEMWSAKSSYLRKHQLRMHAFEMGLPILGESIYTKCSMPQMSEFKKFFKENRKGETSNM